MVRNASADQKWSSALPSSQEMSVRRISSFFLMATLLTVLYPFSPFSWIFTSDGPELLDRFLAPPLLLGSLYFQWRIANIIAPLGIDIAGYWYVYRQSMYWQCAFAEFAICVGVGMAQHEILRRVAALALTGVLWIVGYAATPQSVKNEAWAQLKWVWTYMAFNEALGMVRGGRRRW